MEEVDLCELLDAGQVAVAPFVGGRDEPVLEREALRLAPQRRELDGVDALAPGVPLREPRLVQPVVELQPVERSARLGAELLDLGLELAQPRERQHAVQPRYEQRSRRDTGCRAAAASA